LKELHFERKTSQSKLYLWSTDLWFLLEQLQESPPIILTDAAINELEFDEAPAGDIF
jgi:hypothetical protein